MKTTTPNKPNLRWRIYYRKEHLLCRYRNFKDRHPFPLWLKSLVHDIGHLISIWLRTWRGW